MQLRDYQSAAIKATWDWFRGSRNLRNPAIVIPTGGGKSLIIAETARQASTKWGKRVGIVAAQRELIEQNRAQLLTIWPDADVGVYSAGMGLRDTSNAVMFLQIQSVFDSAKIFGKFDLLLFDEMHLIRTDGEGRFHRFIAGCRAQSPAVRMVGYSATPYRLDSGMVCGDSHVFNEIAYEKPLSEMIAEGYLCKLVSKVGGEAPDLSGVKKRGGDYVESELAKVMDNSDIIIPAVHSMVERAHDRRSWVVFCVSINHAENVCAALRMFGIDAHVVTGETPADVRDSLLSDFRGGNIRALVNVGVLTTGFDAPNIDCIAMLRPTKSTGLYVQMVGRGFRNAPGKADCLVLDFAGNVMEHGPVDMLEVNTDGSSSKKQALRICPQCQEVLSARAKACPCGHVFMPVAIKPEHDMAPSEVPILSGERTSRRVDAMAVDRTTFSIGAGRNGRPDHLLVTHQCGIFLRIKEFICFEHMGAARRRAVAWWHLHGGGMPPLTVADAMARSGGLSMPSVIHVENSGKYPEIVEREFYNQETQTRRVS